MFVDVYLTNVGMIFRECIRLTKFFALVATKDGVSLSVTGENSAWGERFFVNWASYFRGDVVSGGTGSVCREESSINRDMGNVVE